MTILKKLRSQDQDEIANLKALVMKKTKAPAPKQKSPSRPKQPSNSYQLWLAEFRDSDEYQQMKESSAGLADLSKTLASLWDAIEPEAKLVYQERARIACEK